MHVDQARQQGDAGQINALSTSWHRITLTADRGDTAIDDDHLGLISFLTGGDIEEFVRRQGNGLGLRSTRAESEHGGGGEEGGEAHGTSQSNWIFILLARSPAASTGH